MNADTVLSTASLLWLLLAVGLLATLAAGTVTDRYRQTIVTAVGSLTRLLLGLGLFAVILYVTLYFLALVGGFYESLTCKVVTLPACEDPLALPGWLRLPDQSVGGVIGILPLLGIFLAKSMQGPKPESAVMPGNRWSGLLTWLYASAGIIAIFFIELWLAWLRGAAEAADRQVRLSLGLDADLPAAYLGVAQWGAVVLALGLSVVVVYLGVAGRYGLQVSGRGFAELRHGAGLVSLGGALLQVLAGGLTRVWTTVAITVGRLGLKLRYGLTRLYSMAMIALGRAALKIQSVLARTWAFLAILLGRIVLWFGRLGRRRNQGTTLILLAGVLGGLAAQPAMARTYVVLQDISGGEETRLGATNQLILNWADPSPQLALLSRNDRLIVIPIRAPGHLDTVYSTLFNATYPGSQLDRYAFYAELRNALPDTVDDAWGTAVSEALRSAAFYLREAGPEEERVLIIFGNGEDHSPAPIEPSELADGLQGALVIRFNAGLDTHEHWTAVFTAAGARAQLVYDAAATRLLRNEELFRAIERAFE